MTTQTQQVTIFVTNNGTENRYLLNKNIEPGQTQFFGKFAFASIMRDPNIVADIQSGLLVINDGELDLDPTQGIAYVGSPPLRVTENQVPASGTNADYARQLDFSGTTTEEGGSAQVNYDNATGVSKLNADEPTVEQLANVEEATPGESDPADAEVQQEPLITEETFIKRSGVWKISTPKNTPPPIGDIIQFEENFTVGLDTRNDVLIYRGEGGGIVFFPNINFPGIDVNFNFTVRNESPGQLTLQAQPLTKFLGFGSLFRFVQGSPEDDFVNVDPGAEIVFGIKDNQWAVISETATTAARVNNLEIIAGALVNAFQSIKTSESQVIDLTQGNKWYVFVDADALLKIVISEENLQFEIPQFLEFDIAIQQDTVGGHTVAFEDTESDDIEIRWEDNQIPQISTEANAFISQNFTSYDFGSVWYSQTEMKWKDQEEIPQTPLSSTDNVRRQLSVLPTFSGLSVIPSDIITDAFISYKLLGDDRFSTTFEIDIKVDGVTKHTKEFLIPSVGTIMQEINIVIDSTWNINSLSNIELFARETTGQSAQRPELVNDMEEAIMIISFEQLTS